MRRMKRCAIWSGPGRRRCGWLGKARQHLQGFLLRHGRIYPGKKGWTGAYRRWLTMVRFTHPAQQIVLQDYVDAVADAEARVERLTEADRGASADLEPRAGG
jgi:transposase